MYQEAEQAIASEHCSQLLASICEEFWPILDIRLCFLSFDLLAQDV